MSRKEKRNHQKQRKAAAALGVTAAMLILTGMAAAGEGGQGITGITAAALALLAGVWIYSPVHYGKWISAAAAVLLPAAALCCLEYYTHVPQDLTGKIFFLNLLFFLILYGLAAFLTGSIRVGYPIATLVPMLYGLANYYVVSFRSSPIVPWDFLSLRTALTVSNQYSFEVSWRVVLVLEGFVWIMLLAVKSTVKIRKKKIRIPAAAAALAALIVYINAIQLPSVQEYWGMDTILFTLNVMYRNNGIAGAFLGNLRYLQIDAPKGYSAQKAEEILDKGTQALPEDSTEDTKDAKDTAEMESPNVIVIMNEAFSDLSVWGEFETSSEVMPALKQLQQEGIGGTLFVSVKGGNTANTEFEFLTGNTMGFLPAGSVPYQQYLNGPVDSLVSSMEELGYQTAAIHPYKKTGWDRDKVYEYFGFDAFYGMDDFVNPKKYRDYISDQSAVDKIKELLENKEEGKPLFVFEVTMQNHGGYSKDSPGFDIYMSLPQLETKTTSTIAAEKYLTLINLSDQALQDFTDYLRDWDEPTIVLMFGDHQPSDYITNVIRKITGADNEGSLEAVQRGYQVPFVMWSNYGLEHKTCDRISVNYLSSLLMEEAGLPLTKYQLWLKGLSKVFPVITGNCYQDAQGNYYELDDSTLPAQIQDYQILQYHQLFDR